MRRPAIKVLGVYRLSDINGLIEKRFSGFDSRDAHFESALRQEAEGAVLVEVLVANRNSLFKIDDFTQPIEGIKPGLWQAAWSEVYLTINGDDLLAEADPGPPQSRDLRIAFFIHYWNTRALLRTCYGDIECPSPQPMPERLRKLVPYDFVH